MDKEKRKLWRERNRDKLNALKLRWAKSENGKASQRSYRAKSPKAMFYLYKGSAKQRNIIFDISEELFSELIQKDCVYCGKQAKDKRNGLDRINNDKGYIKSNIVPCCFKCNQMKGKLTANEFMNHIMEVIKHAN